MDSRLNTMNAPRFVLEVDIALDWLTEVAQTSEGVTRAARSPMDAEVSFDLDWCLLNLHGSSAAAGDARVGLSVLLTAAQEIGALVAPDGVWLEMEAGDDGYRFLLGSDSRWPQLLLAGRDHLFEDGYAEERNARGVNAVMEFLMSAVQDANVMLTALVQASTLVLAQFSTDPLLVTRLADHSDAQVRTVAVDNPVAPDEAKVLRALKDQDEI